MIYMDNSATTWPKPESVYQEADRLNRTLAFNAGRGISSASEKAQEVIDAARKSVASLAKTSPDNVFFSLSATLALNQIIFGLDLKENDTVYISPFEHNAIVRPLQSIKGLNIKVLPFDRRTWRFDQQKTIELFAYDPPKAVFVSEVSNVTGYRLPWEDIFKLADSYQAVTILDASQSFGNLEGDYSGLDFLVFNGHKSLYGLMGAGGFINFTGKPLIPWVFGGTGSDSLSASMPESGALRYEAGTHNLPAIGSLVSGIEWLQSEDHSLKRRLAKRLAEGLRQIDGVTVYLPEEVESEGIVSFNLDGYTADELASILDHDFGFALRSGYHCSPLIHEFIGSDRFAGTVRASLGYFNTEDEIDKLLEAVDELGGEM